MLQVFIGDFAERLTCRQLGGDVADFAPILLGEFEQHREGREGHAAMGADLILGGFRIPNQQAGIPQAVEDCLELGFVEIRKMRSQLLRAP